MPKGKSSQSHPRNDEGRSRLQDNPGEGWHEPSRWYANEEHQLQQNRQQRWGGGLGNQQQIRGSERNMQEGKYENQYGSGTTGRNYASGGTRQNFRDEDQNRSRYR